MLCRRPQGQLSTQVQLLNAASLEVSPPLEQAKLDLVLKWEKQTESMLCLLKCSGKISFSLLLVVLQTLISYEEISFCYLERINGGERERETIFMERKRQLLYLQKRLKFESPTFPRVSKVASLWSCGQTTEVSALQFFRMP